MYLTFALVQLPPFPPIAGPENPNDMMTIREPNGQHATLDEARAAVPLLHRAVGKVFRNDTKRIGEGQLRRRKRNPMLLLILQQAAKQPFQPSVTSRACTSGTKAEHPRRMLKKADQQGRSE